MSIKVTSSADTEKKIIDQELEIAVEKLRANPADISIIQEINNIRIKYINVSKHITNTETASTNFESSNDAQLSSTNTETSNNKGSSEHSSRRLNDDNQNNSYFQMVRNRGFQWMDAVILGLIICVIGAYILKQISGQKTTYTCIILFIILVACFICDILSKDACKKRRARRIDPQGQ